MFSLSVTCISILSKRGFRRAKVLIGTWSGLLTFTFIDHGMFLASRTPPKISSLFSTTKNFIVLLFPSKLMIHFEYIFEQGARLRLRVYVFLLSVLFHPHWLERPPLFHGIDSAPLLGNDWAYSHGCTSGLLQSMLFNRTSVHFLKPS